MQGISWNEAIIIIYFFYGLAFYSMGLALLVESGRASELGFARSMRLLAGFGLLHGIHEWIELSERALEVFYETTLPESVLWLRLSLLVASFIALMMFGEHLLSSERRQLNWRLTLLVAVWFGVSCVIVRTTYQLDDGEWRHVIDVLSRYTLGIPSAVMACWALWKQRKIFQEQGVGRFGNDLSVAAFALSIYGIVGQIFVSSAVVFPANFINSDLFLQITGFPIQILRVVMAVAVAVAMIRVLRALEVENQQRLDLIETEMLAAEQLSRDELARLNRELQAANEQTAQLLKEVQQRDARRGELIQRITAAQEAERRRIARELHDGTGQALTGLALGLRGLAAQVGKDIGLVERRLPILEAMATSSLGELRHLINDLRPPQLDDMGLVAALRWMTDRFKEHSGPEILFEVSGEVYSLPSEVETTLFRIAQEALNNTLKHAQAEHVWIQIEFCEILSLTIRDDGLGFDTAAMLNADGTRSSWGLVGMQERANLINAKLELDSKPGEGTILTLSLLRQRS